ncbi:helix-turn-helix domain-containing protein [Viridibacillus arvi]|uniref:winged helix-turn-helix transcriptional regulator n=1 Tax=Viridibacillus arvi TaxID=263475 RepID=UPI003CFF3604
MKHQCNSEKILQVFIGKWKLVVLFQLLEHGTLRFNELQRLIPGITKRMLTMQLRELEYHSIVKREIYPVVPPKVEYSITEYGQTVSPIIYYMKEWGMEHTKVLEGLHGNVDETENPLSPKID